MDLLIEHYDVGNIDNFYYAIGMGDILAIEVLKVIETNTFDTKESTEDAIIQNVSDNYHIKMCKFCSPLPGDVIFAGLPRHSYGITSYSIHREGCKVGVPTQSASWVSHTKELYVARMEITLTDKANSIATALTYLKDNNITSIYIRAALGYDATGKISAQFRDLNEYEKVTGEMLKDECVKKIARTLGDENATDK